MTDQQYTDLIAFLERKFAETRIHEALLYEGLRDDLRAAERRLRARIVGVVKRLEEVERRRGIGDSRWTAQMPQA